MKSRGTWFFPLILATVMGGISFWLDRVSQIETVPIELNPHEPKYRINGIHGERFDSQGLLSERLSATSAWQLPTQPVVYIDNPQLMLLAHGKPLYQVSSTSAQYDTDSRQVVFLDKVLLYKSATANQAEAMLRTDKLTVDTQSQTAHTDASVDYRYGLSEGSAVGFEYNKDKGFLNLSSRIKAIIYDPKNSPQ